MGLEGEDSEIRGMLKRHSYPTNAKRAFGVDLGERLNGVHPVDFLIWRSSAQSAIQTTHMPKTLHTLWKTT